MDVRALKIDPRSLGDHLMLTAVVPYKKYENGVATDEIAGYKYVVACPSLQLEKIAVKIPGKQLLHEPDGDFPIVRFNDLVITPYIMNGNLGVTATASNVVEQK